LWVIESFITRLFRRALTPIYSDLLGFEVLVSFPFTFRVALDRRRMLCDQMSERYALLLWA
jgi:hypothetical protein